MPNQESNLKNCPFCGSKPEIDYVLNFPPDDYQWYVMCTTHNCVNPASWNEDKDLAISFWNKRS